MVETITPHEQKTVEPEGVTQRPLVKRKRVTGEFRYSFDSQTPISAPPQIEPFRPKCVVILTATDTEYKAVREHLDELSLEWIWPDDTRVHEKMQFHDDGKSWDVIIIKTGQGGYHATVETLLALQRYKPKTVLFLGTAGGIKTSDLNLGDVVVANKIYSYEFGRTDKVDDPGTGSEEPKFYARPELYYPDPALTNLAERLRSKPKWRRRIKEMRNKEEAIDREVREAEVYPGPLATGGQILASTKASAYKIIKEHYNDTLAVEMEGFGFIIAVQEDKNVHAAVIRGISDLVEHEDKETTDQEGWPGIAMANASAFAFELIANFS
jgi:nucleoside phosphorylase